MNRPYGKSCIFPIVWTTGTLLLFFTVRKHRFNSKLRTVLSVNCLLCNFCCVTLGNCLIFYCLTKLSIQDYINGQQEDVTSVPYGFQAVNFAMTLLFGIFQFFYCNYWLQKFGEFWSFCSNNTPRIYFTIAAPAG